MMEQYLRMKQSLPPDVWLFFRIGDFYEMFFEDAQECSAALGLTLTKRQTIPMCGVPYHAAEGYIGQIVQLGKRVAIADQMTTPVPGKLVEREITRIISAGTLADLSLLNESEHNYIAACYRDKKSWGLACADHTTGDFTVADYASLDELSDEISRIRPRELLVSDEQKDEFAALPVTLYYDAYTFLPAVARPTLEAHFRVHSLDGFGCAHLGPALGAAAAILHYLRNQLRRSTEHLRRLALRRTDGAVLIDESSRRNLDLVESRSGTKGTLLATLDTTTTPMGARLMREWMLHPICDLPELQRRQDIIAAFLKEPFLMSKLRDSLRRVRDTERLTSRLAQGAGNARDLLALGCSLSHLPDIEQDLHAVSLHEAKLAPLGKELGDFRELTELLARAVVDEPPVSLKEGGMIRDGYDPRLDELRRASHEGKNWLTELEARERAATGIESLKVRYNNIFGYYIEVTKANYSKVPERYVRKQTLANAERYVTDELKQMEGTILGADERARQLEYELFCKLRDDVRAYIDPIQVSARALAEIDVLLSLAESAQRHRYCRPQLDVTRRLHIVNGRHPVIEQVQTESSFVPNDTVMDEESDRVLILTGPNMAGKSTYIRQVALITLMAQMGSYVPADEAQIGVVDRIFCRVGASDDIARGQSTFMVEMSETALILNNATARSLVILDEIGRGTATFDGLSIAWAVAEHLHDVIGARTLFATHYHEMVDLQNTHPAVSNWHVEVREWKDEIVFLRKVLPGPADKSYGIQVARLAGLPAPIISRAKQILTHLEMTAAAREPRAARRKRAKATGMPAASEADVTQLDMFDLLDPGTD
ncbi:MAG TPA: DNA mismatch repair protein MutS [Candidatus Akkermansia intestinigallinarum]|uniref:DNA mismatch repair protein MutS n=1 Tax=Candidatus Akkermansia intestinigallinarum TaxID=2838431 RepID=A0A9D1VAE7_9BACT|nr:DNA mismatch repair protein MutS [Candidatus Akkermansia intestinigallinarum]